jgi:glycerol-3-phosphate dehydrogenase
MASQEGYTSKVSRSHFLAEHKPDDTRAFPVYSMVGGKLTTFRAFAEMTADRLMPLLGVTRRCPQRTVIIRNQKRSLARH